MTALGQAPGEENFLKCKIISLKIKPNSGEKLKEREGERVLTREREGERVLITAYKYKYLTSKIIMTN